MGFVPSIGSPAALAFSYTHPSRMHWSRSRFSTILITGSLLVPVLLHVVQDVTALLHGHIDQLEAQRRLNVRTRRYAKRQRTWMRRLPEVAMVAAERNPRAIAAEIVATR